MRAFGHFNISGRMSIYPIPLTRFDPVFPSKRWLNRIGAFGRTEESKPPNKAPEPTRGTGAVLLFQSRWPRVAQLGRSAKMKQVIASAISAASVALCYWVIY